MPFSVGSGGILIAPDNSGSPGTFVTSTQGFDFGSLTEGGTPGAQQHFWLKNATTTDVTVNETAADASASLSPTRHLPTVPNTMRG